MKKYPFKVKESGYHKGAKIILCGWVNGLMEKEYTVDGSIVFVPDVTVYKNGILDCIYEIINTHPLTAKKYGMIQYWCYMNKTDLTVYEISADYILAQTEKPDPIRTKECYTVSLLEYEDNNLIKELC